MNRNTNDELPDDLLDRLKLLNEQPDDYDADTRPLVPLNEDDIGNQHRELAFGILHTSTIVLGDTSAMMNGFCCQMTAKSISKWMRKPLDQMMH